LRVRKLGGSDIKWSNPYGNETTHFVGCTENPNAENSSCNHKKTITTFDPRPIFMHIIHQQRENAIRVGYYCNAKNMKVN
jgi:hypothetical protein